MRPEFAVKLVQLLANIMHWSSYSCQRGPLGVLGMLTTWLPCCYRHLLLQMTMANSSLKGDQ